MNLALASSQTPAHWQLRRPAHVLACQALAKLLPSYLAALQGECSGATEARLAARFDRALDLVSAASREPAIGLPVEGPEACSLLTIADLAWVLRGQLQALAKARGLTQQVEWTRRLVATQAQLQELLGGRR